MSITTIGDMAQQFSSLRAGGAIKSDLARLSATLSSGRVADITKHLDGETAHYSAINHSLDKLGVYQQVARETEQVLDSIQQVLQRVDAMRDQLSDQLLSVNDSSSRSQVNDAARAAQDGLDVMVRTLNTRLNDRALLAGRDVDATPLINAQTMIAQISAVIGTDRSSQGIAAAVNAWFDDPNGGFAQSGYLGDATGLMERTINQDQRISVTLRADDVAIRDMLKSAALAAVTHGLPGLDPMTKSNLVQTAGAQLFGAAAGLAGAQSRIGGVQAAVTETQVQLGAQQTGLKMAVNNLVSADPFDTATRLQAVQLQLETHFTVVGRLSQLSLLRFI